MKTEFLKAMGLTDEQIADIMKENGKDVSAAKAKFADYDDLKTQLADAQKKLAEKPAVDADKLQADLDAERAGRAKDRQEFQLRAALEKAGAADADYLLYKLADSAKFDKDGKLEDAENFIKAAREAHPTMFRQEPAYSPAGGSGEAVKNPWKKETFNLTEQGRIYKENPAQAKELMAAAGAE